MRKEVLENWSCHQETEAYFLKNLCCHQETEACFHEMVVVETQVEAGRRWVWVVVLTDQKGVEAWGVGNVVVEGSGMEVGAWQGVGFA